MSLAEAFEQVTGRQPAGVWSAPGRVNLIGEHTDYNGGCVLPFAMPLRTAVAAARRPDRTLRLWSRQQPGPAVEVALDSLAPGSVPGWAGYPAGVAWALRAAGHALGGVDLLVDGAVPAGAGLSSSAALECAVALALVDLHELAVEPAWLARQAQRAENDFVGVPCGLMDQMVAMTAVQGHVLFFDTASGSTEHIGVDLAGAGFALLVIDTRAGHAHAGGHYGDRRRECRDAAALLGVAALGELSSPELSPPELDRALERLADTPLLARRVRHVVTENARTVQAAELLRAGRVAALGPLLNASHDSLRADFEVSTPQLDAVVSAARGAGAAGARLTGGGFGGCAVALVAEQHREAVLDAVRTAATAAGYPSPAALDVTPAAGAHRDDEPAPTQPEQEKAARWRQ